MRVLIPETFIINTFRAILTMLLTQTKMLMVEKFKQLAATHDPGSFWNLEIQEQIGRLEKKQSKNRKRQKAP